MVLGGGDFVRQSLHECNWYLYKRSQSAPWPLLPGVTQERHLFITYKTGPHQTMNQPAPGFWTFESL